MEEGGKSKHLFLSIWRSSLIDLESITKVSL